MIRNVKLSGKDLKETEYRHYYAGKDGHIYRHVKKTAFMDSEDLILFSSFPYWYFMMIPEYKCNERANHLQVNICIDGLMKAVRLDILIANTWLIKRNDDWRLDHIDGDMFNNKPDNLIWVFNKDLYDILTDREFQMWSRKLDTMEKKKWDGFNEKLLKGYIDRYFEFKKDAEKRKVYFERALYTENILK